MKWNQRTLWIAAMPTLILLVVAALAVAGPLNVTHTFTPNTVADALQVNQNFTDVETAVNDNNTRLTTVEGQLTALQANGQVVAAAHIRVWTDNTITVLRGFSNLPGAPAITPSRSGVGTYLVDFGANIAGRHYTATIGGGSNFLIIGPPFPVLQSPGFVTASNALANLNAVAVSTFNAGGGLADSSFFIVIH